MNAFQDVVSGITSLANFLRNKSGDLAKIEASIAYLKAIQGVRLAVIGLMGLAAALMIMMMTLVALHLFVFFVIPLQTAGRLWASGALLFLDCALTGGILYAVISERVWMRLSKADKVTVTTIRETVPEAAAEEAEAPIEEEEVPQEDISGEDIRKAS